MGGGGPEAMGVIMIQGGKQWHGHVKYKNGSILYKYLHSFIVSEPSERVLHSLPNFFSRSRNHAFAQIAGEKKVSKLAGGKKQTI